MLTIVAKKAENTQTAVSQFHLQLYYQEILMYETICCCNVLLVQHQSCESDKQKGPAHLDPI